MTLEVLGYCKKPYEYLRFTLSLVSCFCRRRVRAARRPFGSFLACTQHHFCFSQKLDWRVTLEVLGCFEKAYKYLRFTLSLVSYFWRERVRAAKRRFGSFFGSITQHRVRAARRRFGSFLACTQHHFCFSQKLDWRVTLEVLGCFEKAYKYLRFTLSLVSYFWRERVRAAKRRFGSFFGSIKQHKNKL